MQIQPTGEPIKYMLFVYSRSQDRDGVCYCDTDHAGRVMAVVGIAMITQIQLIHVPLLAVGANKYPHAEKGAVVPYMMRERKGGWL